MDAQNSESSSSSTPATSTAEIVGYDSLKFPIRLGLTWQKGFRLEAQDILNNWYKAKVADVDVENLRVLIHFDGWNSRYDEWFETASDKLRPTQAALREARKVFKVGEPVLAKWNDAKMYPATIKAARPDGTFDVLFYDGVKKNMPFADLKRIQGVVHDQEHRQQLLQQHQPPQHKRPPNQPPSQPAAPPPLPPPIQPPVESVVKRVPKPKRNDEDFVTLETKKKVRIVNSPSVQPETPTPKPKKEAKPKEHLQIKLKKPKKLKAEPKEVIEPLVEVVTTVESTDERRLSESQSKDGVDVEEYKCNQENCNKSFRKRHLLEYHMKYFHNTDSSPVQSSVKKRKRTVSQEEADLNRSWSNMSENEESDDRTHPRSEIINCACQTTLEDGFMVQCERCFCWQHGACCKVTSDAELPENYICFVCREKPGLRESRKHMLALLTWLDSGVLPSLSDAGDDDKRRGQVVTISKLIGDVLLIQKQLNAIDQQIHSEESTKIASDVQAEIAMDFDDQVVVDESLQSSNRKRYESECSDIDILTVEGAERVSMNSIFSQHVLDEQRKLDSQLDKIEQLVATLEQSWDHQLGPKQAKSKHPLDNAKISSSIRQLIEDVLKMQMILAK